MAIINVAFGFVGGRGNNHPPLFRKSGAAETIAAALTSTQTSIEAEATTYGVACAAARIYTDTAVWYEVGANPTAVANTSMYLPAGSVEFVYVTFGDKIAFLEA